MADWSTVCVVAANNNQGAGAMAGAVIVQWIRPAQRCSNMSRPRACPGSAPSTRSP
jgi:hypothetical protein